MATTFAPAFKNRTIDSITGRASNGATLYFVSPYSGAQTADPTVAPAGSFIYTSYSQAPPIGAFMTQSAVGVSNLTSARVGSVGANNAVTAAFARILDSGGTAVIDTAITNSGGGGGVFAAVLASGVGVPFQIDSFSFKVPLILGTVLFNVALADAINTIWCTTSNSIAALSSATVSVYTGAAPATADLPATGTLLVTWTTAATGASWNASSAGSAALAAPLTSAAAVATGTAGYARITKNLYTLQTAVGTAATDLIINTTSIVIGTTYSLTDATITL